MPTGRTVRVLAGFVVVLLAVACQDGTDDAANGGGTSSDEATADDATGEGPDDGGGSDDGAVEPPVAEPVRHPATARPIYVVMTDRFANGDPDNDRGGIESTDALATGYLPADAGYHQGGDLAGLVDEFDYVEGLGVGAIWITPPFTNEFVVGDGTVEGSSSSYHGYWPTDHSTVDPHLGTDDDLRRLVEEAHARDIDVHLDLAVDRTSDVEGLADMTELDAARVAELGVDGLRLDTVQPVGPERWAAWLAEVRQTVADAGSADLFTLGGTFGEDPSEQASTMASPRMLGADGTLDVVVAAALETYVGGGPSSAMTDAFDADDTLTDADGNASTQATFLGNHDTGRMGHLLAQAVPGADDDELLDRMRLGFDLLFTIRGVPVVTWGDEQGFVGDGGDEAARATMFPAIAASYVDDDNIGTDTTPAGDNVDTEHPLYRHVAARAATRAEVPALVTGAMVVHEVEADQVFAFSRVDRDEQVEVLVVANSSTQPMTVFVPTLSPDTTFAALPGFEARQRRTTSGPDGTLEVDVPALGTVVVQAGSPVPASEDAPEVRLVRPEPGAEVTTPRQRLAAEVPGGRLAEVTFAASVDGADPIVLGVDDVAPHRVWWDTAALPDGASVELFATVADGSGRTATDRVELTLGDGDR